MYTIGDFLIQMKNAYMAHKKTFEYDYSNAVASIAKVLESEKYVKKVSVIEASKDKKEHKKLIIELQYNSNEPALSGLKLVSRPSVHYYADKVQIKKGARKHGISIVSTSKGIMTNKKALSEGVGGEILCELY